MCNLSGIKSIDVGYWIENQDIEQRTSRGYSLRMKPNKPGLRILALDLDDTILRSDLTISYRTRSAIKRAEAAGAVIVLASSRIPEAMEHSAVLLGLDRNPGYLISNNGALILESHTGKIIHEVKIEAETALSICDLADAEGFPMQMYDDDIMYVSRKNEYSDLDQRTNGIRQVVVENFRDMVAEGCHRLIIPGDPSILSHVKDIVMNYLGDKVTLFYSRPYFVEIMPKGTDKGSALALIAEILGVSAGEVMAIGDSMNDEAMIRWAGVGVAMANGNDHIKNIADLVTDSTNDDDGVAEVIEKYFIDANKVGEGAAG